MPAPPPESEPAIVRARGTSAGKVIPSPRLERAFGAVRQDGDQPFLGDLADVGERNPESLLQVFGCARNLVRVQRREQLVVLATGECELERVHGDRSREISQLPG